jgi:uncharacterized protein
MKKGLQPAIAGPVLVSIHDAMPANFTKIIEIVKYLRSLQVRPITLLVVAGAGWPKPAISRLKALQASDVELAGHGWTHRADQWHSLKHRLHGFVLSRNEAEHLALPAGEIPPLIRRSHDWFSEAGLKPPRLYVPPTWAMGAIPRKTLASLPYRYYENLFGVYDSFGKRMFPMAVCGYMADTRLRAWGLRRLNALNQWLSNYPLRIAIHPDDLDLPLAAELAACLKRCSHFVGYTDLFDPRH